MILRLILNISYNGPGFRTPTVHGAHEGAKGVKTNRKIESAEVPRIDAGTLLAAGKEIILVHKDTEYRLRLTSNDKLILTK